MTTTIIITSIYITMMRALATIAPRNMQMQIAMPKDDLAEQVAAEIMAITSTL
jgi:hypothetical protein